MSVFYRLKFIGWVCGFLPFLALAGVSNQVASVVNSVDIHLQMVGVALTLAENDAKNTISNLDKFQEENYSLCRASSNFQFAVTSSVDCLYNIRLAQGELSRARAVLQTIPLVADGMVTNQVYLVTNVVLNVTNVIVQTQVVTNCCDNCSRQLDTILSLVQEDLRVDQDNQFTLGYINLKLNDNQVSLDNDLAALKMGQTMISNMIERVSGDNGNIGEGGGTGSGGGCSCPDYSTYLQQIYDTLVLCYEEVETIRIYMQGWDLKFHDYLDFWNSLQEEISKYYDLLNRRYSTFDSRLPGALREMFDSTLSAIDTVTSRLRLGGFSSAQSVLDLLNSPDFSGENPLELSSEGVISLYSAATLDRSYLTQVKIYEWMTNHNYAVSNYVDLGWLEDYLLKVQRPYFSYFNQTLGLFTYSSVNSSRNLPFGNATSEGDYLFVSNFFAAVRSRWYPGFRPSMAINFNSYRQHVTNWFDRIEFLLMGLNGLILPPDDTGALSDSEKTELEETFFSVSNDWSSLVRVAEASSNDFSRVMDAMKQCLDAFDVEIIDTDDRFRILPSGSVFGVHYPAIELEYSAIRDFTDPIRQLFKWLWVVFFGVSGFAFFIFYVRAVVTAVWRVYLFLNVSLSPS